MENLWQMEAEQSSNHSSFIKDLNPTLHSAALLQVQRNEKGCLFCKEPPGKQGMTIDVGSTSRPNSDFSQEDC